MKTTHLASLTRPQPRCASFDEEQSVREYERAMREHRAYTESYDITPLEERVDGGFRVQGKGDSYLVDIVDGSGALDSCSCLDFLTNELSTCKHIEAVRRALATNKTWRGAYTRLGEAASRPTVAVATSGALRLVRTGKWTKGLLAKTGLTEHDDGSLSPTSAASWPQLAQMHVRVVHAAAPAWVWLSKQRALEERRARVRDAITDGRLGLDVLAEPLLPYQREGVAHLAAAGRALLADDMGLGKTTQTIAACEVLAAQGEARRVLIVTPASLKDEWAREIERLTGVRAVVVGGSDKARRAALASDARYKIVNYELTWRELDRLQELDADVLVLDEAQRARNFRTKTATTLRAIPSRFLFVLTGTPFEHRLDDLYALMQLIDPAHFSPLWKFNFQFHEQNDRGTVTGYKNLGLLREKLSPLVLRRRKEDVLAQLPAISFQTRHVPLLPTQQQREQQHRAHAASLLVLGEKRPLSATEAAALHRSLDAALRASSALSLTGESEDDASHSAPKLDEFETIVEELRSQGASKLVVFSSWDAMLTLAAERLDKLGVGHRMLTGSLSPERRAAALASFADDAETRVMLATDEGSAGQSLQHGSYVVHLDLPLSIEQLDRRNARVHRVGLNRGVSVVYLCAASGIERGIEATMETRRGQHDITLEALRQVLVRAGHDALLTAADAPPRTEHSPQTLAVSPLSHVPDAQPSPAANEAPVQVTDERAAPITLRPTAPAEPAPLTQRTDVASTPPRQAMQAHRATERLRLARVVLDAGFSSDAIRAAYEALSLAIATRLSGPAPRDHAQLVGRIFTELLPAGKLPPSAHAALARLRDLTELDALSIEVAPSIAQEVVDEAEAWVSRLLIAG